MEQVHNEIKGKREGNKTIVAMIINNNYYTIKQIKCDCGL